MEIKILLPEHSGKKIRNIICAHSQSESQKKHRFSFYRCLSKPVIYQGSQLCGCRLHGLWRTGFMKRFYYDISVNILSYICKRFFQPGSLINIPFQMVSKRHQFHFFIQIMKDHICIFILKAFQTYHLTKTLNCFSCKLKILHTVKSNRLLKIQILHSIFYFSSPSSLLCILSSIL